MNCRDIEKLLAEGRPLTAGAARHVAECNGCRSLMDSLTVAPDLAGVRHLQGAFSELLPQLSAVKPLPSDPVLILTIAGSFAGFCLLVAAAFGLQGFFQLTMVERAIYYGLVGLLGLLYSVATVQSAIPGAKVRVQRHGVVVGSVIAMSLTVALLFRHYGLDQFVTQGFPCLRLGCFCAALFGILAAFVLKKGCVTDVRSTSLLLGCFAGFSGVAVLSLHCPLHNALHIIVWHLGAMAVSAWVALASGSLILRRS